MLPSMSSLAAIPCVGACLAPGEACLLVGGGGGPGRCAPELRAQKCSGFPVSNLPLQAFAGKKMTWLGKYRIIPTLLYMFAV